MLSGTEMLDGDGKKVTGTIATKTASSLTASGATVTVPAGYYAANASKSVGTATQAKPIINVGSDGEITATATQSAGYVAAGTESADPVRLTTQGAQTITPGTADQTIASGRYLTGTQTIKGDANLVAGNIAKDVTIFGVTGTHEGGEDISAETAEYTELLTDLETAIDALPDAGSGGGAAVETCTVNVVCNRSRIKGYTYLSYKNGVFTPSFVNFGASGSTLNATLTDVVCNSYVYVQTGIDKTFLAWTVNSGDATVFCDEPTMISTAFSVVIIQAPITAGSESTVTIIDND